MLFNSLSFLIFFPLVTAGYFLLPHRWRWAWLLAASCYFYMAFIPAYILILFVTITIDYVAGILIERAQGKRRRIFLLASLGANIGMLAFFKYFNFLNTNLAALAEFLHWNYPIPLLDIALPLGLSFHTFQSMSYTIEVYRGRWHAERHLGILALYVLFYPQLVAGPIERPYNLLNQFRVAHKFEHARVAAGLKRMAWGFFKKLVIADRLADFVNPIYGAPTQHQGAALTLATIFFAYQIYCDFSGYSDIAIGAAQVMGFRLMPNFNRPYAAHSIAEFWRRWHISLSTWFRDYFYIPLGGNRVSHARWQFNLFITFLVSGLWHGANWTFVIWGALHGLYLLAGIWTRDVRAQLRAHLNLPPHLTQAGSIVGTFALVAFAWIFFRANTLDDAWYIVTHLFSDSAWLANTLAHLNMAKVAVPAIVFLELAQWLHSHGYVRLAQQSVWVRRAAYYALVMTILLFGKFAEQKFIYFQF